MRKFTLETITVNAAGPVESEACNAIIFTNLGDTEITVDNLPVPIYASGMQEYPSLTFYGLEGETMFNTFTVKFSGSPVTKRILVTRKKYI